MDIQKDDVPMRINSKEDGEEPVEVARIHAIYHTHSAKRKRSLCYLLIDWANKQLQENDPENPTPTTDVGGKTV